MKRGRLPIVISGVAALIVLVVSRTLFNGTAIPIAPVTPASIPLPDRSGLPPGGTPRPTPIPAEAWAEADVKTLRLHPDAFSVLPPSIREVLVRLDCTIPQTYEDERPHNVVSGRFMSPTGIDWAVLCSRDRISAILVFPGGAPESPIELAPAPDVNYLQGIGGTAIGFSRDVTVARPQSIRANYQAHGGETPPPLDHDGIDNAFVGKASHVFYWYSGRWLELTGSD